MGLTVTRMGQSIRRQGGSYTGQSSCSVHENRNGATDTVGYWYGTFKDAGFPGAYARHTRHERARDGRHSCGRLRLHPHQEPSVGANYLTEIQMAASIAHSHFFYDVLWVNSGINVTTTSTVQAIVSPTLPARDVNGTTNGEGCVIGLYFSAASLS